MFSKLWSTRTVEYAKSINKYKFEHFNDKTIYHIPTFKYFGHCISDIFILIIRN